MSLSGKLPKSSGWKRKSAFCHLSHQGPTMSVNLMVTCDTSLAHLPRNTVHVVSVSYHLLHVSTVTVHRKFTTHAQLWRMLGGHRRSSPFCREGRELLGFPKGAQLLSRVSAWKAIGPEGSIWVNLPPWSWPFALLPLWPHSKKEKIAFLLPLKIDFCMQHDVVLYFTG